jgi:hypothetical protein
MEEIKQLRPTNQFAVLECTRLASTHQTVGDTEGFFFMLSNSLKAHNIPTVHTSNNQLFHCAVEWLVNLLRIRGGRDSKFDYHSENFHGFPQFLDKIAGAVSIVKTAVFFHIVPNSQAALYDLCS